MPNSKKRKKPGAARSSTNGAGHAAYTTSATSDTPVTTSAAATTAATTAPAKRRLPPWARRALFIAGGILLVAILAVGGYIYWVVERAMPTVNGSVQLAGLSASATVVRDSSGIPHITAATRHDLFMAQGYVHAQDRLFQMDFVRRLASGRLAEVAGPGAIDTDKSYRTLGLRRAAEAEVATLPADVLADLNAYADGVNAFIDTHHDQLPLEYSLLGGAPYPWTPADSITFGKLMAWYLGSSNLGNELVMSDLLTKLGPDKTAQLMPMYPQDQPTIVRQSALPGNPLGSLSGDPTLRTLLAGYLGQPGIGSNNWVVDGTRSATGKPLLANDPHLGVQNPSIWYINQLRLADGSLDVAGTSFASAPGVVIGHNKDIAWGVTNLGADVQDLFLEKLDPVAHPGQYEYKGAWQPLQFITETIHVKDSPDEPMTITSTVHGPLIDPIISTVQGPTALEWTASGPDGLIAAVLHLQTAHDWTSFRAALSTWDVPGQNFVYADTQGNIGYQATGKIPIRNKGTGAAPVDGASGDYDWTGTIPFDQLPSVYNPPQHYIVTANNRVVGDSYPHLITTIWSPGYRAARIEEMITATAKLSVDDFKRIQNDVQSDYAQTVAPYYAALKSDDPNIQPLIQSFANWNGTLAPDSGTAAIYEVAYDHLMSSTLSTALGPTLAEEYLGNSTGEASLFFLSALKDANSPWWDDPTTTEHETRDTRLLSSLQQAQSDLASQSGDDPTTWQWGAIHQIYFAHPVGAIFNVGPFPTGGDGTTVNTGAFDPGLGFVQTYHASTRQITEVGNWDTMQIIIAPGQSGQPFSKHWNDLAADWLAGRYRPLHVEPASFQADAEGTLTLQP